MPLPNDVLARLCGLSGYEQMLEIDAVSRNHGISSDQIQQEMAAFQAGPVVPTQPTEIDPFADFNPGAHKDLVDLSQAQPVNTGPQFIDKPDQYRMKYNPSQEGRDKQSQVKQAIICPSCSSPLGIPDVRPIRVTCPQCLHEAFFNS